MKKLLKILISYFPTRLPVGMTEFKKWSADIIEIVGPIADEDSLRFAIASQVLHSPAKTDKVPKQAFVAALRKAAANQIASAVFQDIKLRQQAAAEAAQKALQETTVQETTAQGEQ